MIDFDMNAFVVNEAVTLKTIKTYAIKLFTKIRELLTKAKDKLMTLFSKVFGKRGEKISAMQKAYEEFKSNPDKYETTATVSTFISKITDVNHITGISDSLLDIMEETAECLGKRDQSSGDKLEELSAKLVKIANTEFDMDIKNSEPDFCMMAAKARTYYSKGFRVNVNEAIKEDCYKSITESGIKTYNTAVTNWYKKAFDRTKKIIDKFNAINETVEHDFKISKDWLDSLFSISWLGMATPTAYVTNVVELLQACYIAVHGSENDIPYPNIDPDK